VLGRRGYGGVFLLCVGASARARTPVVSFFVFMGLGSLCVLGFLLLA